MKQTYVFVAFLLVTFFTHSQTPFFHISTKKMDSTMTSFYGEYLNESFKKEFANTLINYNPAIPFDGEKDYLEIDHSISDLSQITIFTVFKAENDSLTERDVWGVYGEESTLALTTQRAYNNSRQSYYTGVANNKQVLHTFFQSHRSSQAYPNRKTYVSLGIAKKDSTSRFLKGSIAEVIAYDSRLRGSTRLKIETALAIKYGITLSSGENYISSNKKIIWDTEEDSMYSNNIAGIGRDDAVELYQKQSSSANLQELLVLSATEKAQSNEANLSEFSNRNFLVWGDNDANLVLEESSFPNTPQLLSRKWLIKATGSKAKELSTQLQVDAKEMFDGLKAKEAYLLVIDQSGNGDFLPENTMYVEPSEVTENGILVFEKLFWDVDNSGKDVFTFTIKEDLIATMSSADSLLCANATTVINYELQGGIPPYEFSLENSNGFTKQWNRIDNEETINKVEDVPKGIYNLLVTDRLGDTTQTTTIIEEEIPISVDLGSDRQLKYQEVLTLNAEISEIEKVKTYIWTHDESDFTSLEASPKVTAPGTYTLTVTTVQGCEYTDSVFIEESFVKAFTLYPNPSSDGKYSIDIELTGKGDIDVTVFNLLGVQLDNFSIKNRHKVTLKGKAIRQTGVYDIILQTPYETVSKKLIVE